MSQFAETDGEASAAKIGCVGAVAPQSVSPASGQRPQIGRQRQPQDQPLFQNWQLATGNWQLATGAGDRQLAIGRIFEPGKQLPVAAMCVIRETVR